MAKVEASCHCGAVRFEAPSAPEELTECNCSICRRSGWRVAYYRPDEVRFSPDNGPTDVYVWGDRLIAFHRCRTCGCGTHWAPLDPDLDRMGVNARLMSPEVLEGVRIRRFDGAAI